MARESPSSSSAKKPAKTSKAAAARKAAKTIHDDEDVTSDVPDDHDGPEVTDDIEATEVSPKPDEVQSSPEPEEPLDTVSAVSNKTSSSVGTPAAKASSSTPRSNPMSTQRLVRRASPPAGPDEPHAIATTATRIFSISNGTQHANSETISAQAAQKIRAANALAKVKQSPLKPSLRDSTPTRRPSASPSSTLTSAAIVEIPAHKEAPETPSKPPPRPLPDFAQKDHTGASDDDIFFGLVGEIEGWFDYWKLTFDIDKIISGFEIDKIKRMIGMCRYFYRSKKEVNNESMNKAYKTIFVYSAPMIDLDSQSARLTKELSAIQFKNYGSPTKFSDLKRLYDELDIFKLDDDGFIKFWCARIAIQWLNATKVKDPNLNPLLHMDTRAKSGQYAHMSQDEFITEIVTIAKGDDPLYHNDSFIRIGWVGFDNFRATVLSIISKFNGKYKSMEDPAIATDPMILCILRMLVPTHIWVDAMSEGAATSILDLVTRVESVRAKREHSREMLEAYFGIFENCGFGINWFDPRNRHFLVETDIHMNLMTAVLRGFKPVVSPDAIPIPFYPASWNMEKRLLEGKTSDVPRKRQRSRYGSGNKQRFSKAVTTVVSSNNATPRNDYRNNSTNTYSRSKNGYVNYFRESFEKLSSLLTNFSVPKAMIKSMTLRSMTPKNTRRNSLDSEMVQEPSVNKEHFNLLNSDDSLIPNSTETRCMNETGDSKSCIIPTISKAVVSKYVMVKSRGPMSYAVVRLVNVPDAEKLFDLGTGLPNVDRMQTAMRDETFVDKLKLTKNEGSIGTLSLVDSGANMCVIRDDLVGIFGLTRYNLPEPMESHTSDDSVVANSAVQCVILGLNICDLTTVFQALVVSSCSPLFTVGTDFLKYFDVPPIVGDPSLIT